MGPAVVAGLLGLVAWAAFAGGLLHASPIPPTVEVFLPSTAGPGDRFTAHAVANGCAPKSWAWRPAASCTILAGGTTDTAQASCSALGPARLQALALGGGCAAAGGSSSLVIAGVQAIATPICDGTQPAPIVSIATGWYYRPGLQSTGQLNLLVSPGASLAAPAPQRIRQTFTTQECIEVPRP